MILIKNNNVNDFNHTNNRSFKSTYNAKCVKFLKLIFIDFILIEKRLHLKMSIWKKMMIDRRYSVVRIVLKNWRY